MSAITEKSGCSEGGEDQLSDIGPEWFIKHPCLTDAQLKTYKEVNLEESQVLKLQKREKEKIEKLVNKCTLKEQPVQSLPEENDTKLRIVLLGKVGVGKSSLGNLLTGHDKFKSFSSAETGTVTISSYESEEFNVHVIDTPGLFDSEKTDVSTEIAKIFTIFRDGVHAFVITFDLPNPRMTTEDLKVVENLKTTFGEKMMQHTFLAFTKAAAFFNNPGQETENLEQHIQSAQKTTLGEVLGIIGKNVIAVESKGTEYQQSLMRQAVLDLIRESVNNASEECYTAELFEEVKETFRREIEERQRKRRNEQGQLHDEVVHLFHSDLTKRSTGDLVRMVNGPSDEDICEYSSQVQSKVDGMTDEDLKEMIRFEVGNTLKESGMQLLKEKFTSLVKKEITDHQKDVEYHMVDLKGRFADEYKVLGEEFVRGAVNHRVLELEDTEEADMKKQVREQILVFVLTHIHLHDNPTKIQQGLPTTCKQVKEKEVMNMIRYCLQMPDITKRVVEYKKGKTEEKREKAMMIVYKSANAKAADLICDKTLKELTECLSNEIMCLGYVSKMISDVRKQLDPENLQYVSEGDINEIVKDVFVITIGNVTNATFGQRVKMFFSPLFGFNYVKEVMGKYVPDRFTKK